MKNQKRMQILWRIGFLLVFLPFLLQAKTTSVALNRDFTCNLPAPDSISAHPDYNNMVVGWSQVFGAASYNVKVTDKTTNQYVGTYSTTHDTISIGPLTNEHTYLFQVYPVCSNGQISPFHKDIETKMGLTIVDDLIFIDPNNECAMEICFTGNNNSPGNIEQYSAANQLIPWFWTPFLNVCVRGKLFYGNQIKSDFRIYYIVSSHKIYYNFVGCNAMGWPLVDEVNKLKLKDPVTGTTVLTLDPLTNSNGIRILTLTTNYSLVVTKNINLCFSPPGNFTSSPFTSLIMNEVQNNNFLNIKKEDSIIQTINQHYTVFPNPAHEKIIIHSEGIESSHSNYVTLSLFNLRGELILKKLINQNEINNQDYEWLIPELIPGMYVIKIIREDKSEINKITII